MPHKLIILQRFAFAFKTLSPSKFLSKNLAISHPLPLIQVFEESSCQNFASAALEPTQTFSQTLEQHQHFKFAQNRSAQKLFGLRRPIRVSKLPPRFRDNDKWETCFRPSVNKRIFFFDSFCHYYHFNFFLLLLLVTSFPHLMFTKIIHRFS